MLHLCVFAGVRAFASTLLHLAARYAVLLNNKTMNNYIIIFSFDQLFNLTLILLMWRKGWVPNSIPIYIQQDVNLNSLFTMLSEK
jgi:hypothetical protein